MDVDDSAILAARFGGGWLVTVFLSLMLYGIFLGQVYEYYLHWSTDSKTLKYYVVIITITETISSGLTIQATFLYDVSDFGNLIALGTIDWSAGIILILGIVITSLVQSFYIMRINILSQRKRWLTSIVGVMLFLRIVFGFASAVMTYTLEEWAAFRENKGSSTTVAVGLGLSAALDATIAFLLIFYLFRSRTGIRSTNHLIDTLSAYIVNSGLITMCCSTACLITFFTVPNSILFTGMVLMSSKLYANSFVGTLNARRRLQVHQQITVIGSEVFSTGGALKRFSLRALHNEQGQSLGTDQIDSVHDSFEARAGLGVAVFSSDRSLK